jgi:methylenetetrahydrofolate dehydrogenase (NADP+)/methenyltetrahydrofolate cyclohydrolase
MSTTIIDGKKISDQIKLEISEEVKQLKEKYGKYPGLAVILVGQDPASQVYVKMKGKACEECGFYSITENLDADIDEQIIFNKIDELNKNPQINGILVQLPLPKKFNELKIIQLIDPNKDVDGIHPVSIGKLVIGLPTFRSCTPYGIQELLKRYNINPSGKHVVIVGRSNIVGKPIANILLQKAEWANAIVTVTHTGAKDISYYTKQADILIVAVGIPKIIKQDMIKNETVIIDVGVNRVEDKTAKNGYRLVGDVDYEAVFDKASFITPVPKGVGPMTIAMLMKNTLQSFQETIKRNAL